MLFRSISTQKETTANSPISTNHWNWQSFEQSVHRLIHHSHPELPSAKVDMLITRIVDWAFESEEMRRRFEPAALARRCCNGQTLRGFMKGL